MSTSVTSSFKHIDSRSELPRIVRRLWIVPIAASGLGVLAFGILVLLSLVPFSPPSGSPIAELKDISFDSLSDPSGDALDDLVLRIDSIDRDLRPSVRTARAISIFAPSISILPSADHEVTAWSTQATRIGVDVVALSEVLHASGELLDVFDEARNLLSGTSYSDQSSTLGAHVIDVRESFRRSAESLSISSRIVAERQPALQPKFLAGPFDLIDEGESKLIDVSRIGQQASALTVDLLAIGDQVRPFLGQFRDEPNGATNLDDTQLLETMAQVERDLRFSLVKSEGLAKLVDESELDNALSSRMAVLLGLQRALLDISKASLIALEAAEPVLAAARGNSGGILDVEGVLIKTLQTVMERKDEFEESTLLIAHAQETLRELTTGPSRSSLQGLDDLEELLVHMHDGFQLISEIAPIGPDLFGAEGPRRYLVLGQSADELRATGGFVSGLWVVTFNDGVLEDVRYHDAVRVDDWDRLEFYPKPPQPLELHMGADVWFLRDVSWEPDFPTTAQIAADLFNLGQRQDVDGVIAINQWSMLELLSAIGSIPAPQGGEPITSRNFFSKLEEGSDRFGRAYIDLALQGILDQLRKPTSFGSLLKIASALRTSLQERQMLVHLNTPHLQTTIAQSGWDGAMADSATDYLYVVDSNVGWSKVDRNIERTVRYEVDLTRDSGTRITLNLRYNNHSGPSSPSCEPQWRNRGTNYTQLKNACYWNFWRAYVPFGVRLLQHTPVRLPEYSVAVDTLQALPGEDTFSTTERFGKAVLSGLFPLEAGASQDVWLVYDLPADVIHRNNKSIDYKLLIQKQPGIVERGVEIEFELPDGFRLESSSIEPSTMEDTTVTFSIRLQNDTMIEATFVKENGSP